MLTISPVLKDFPRNDLHVFVEGKRLSLEGGLNGITDPEAEVFERDSHYGNAARKYVVSAERRNPGVIEAAGLSDSALRGGAAQAVQGIELEGRFTAW